MERLAREHSEAEFLVIAVREAHPGEITRPHRARTQKVQAARRLAAEEGLGRRVLVDDLEGTVHRAYGGARNPVYVIDAEGHVVFRRAWNHPCEVSEALGALATGGSIPAGESVEIAQLSGRQPIALRLLERGGRQALLDFFRSAPAPVQHRLRESASEAVQPIVKRWD